MLDDEEDPEALLQNLICEYSAMPITQILQHFLDKFQTLEELTNEEVELSNKDEIVL